MTTQQPAAQPDYLDELTRIRSALHAAHKRLNEVMDRITAGPDERLPGEWDECYRALQAIHLATHLATAAIGSEQERRVPVPYLPAAEFAEYLAWRRRAPFDPNLAGGVTALTVEDGS